MSATYVALVRKVLYKEWYKLLAEDNPMSGRNI
jgi:hypothetical protein